MRTFKIYTAGKMGGLDLPQQMDWRFDLESAVRREAAANASMYALSFVHPPLFYRYDKTWHQTEREAMQWDLAQIRDSDIVVVNLDNIADSIGTHMELGFIEAMNQFGNHHIHVIGIGEPNVEHPWLHEMMSRIEPTIADAAVYIAEYLLV